MLAKVADDLCRKKVVLLGENGFHGDGATAAFKANLVERLVTRCGFTGVFFESSHYDFLAFMRRVRAGEPVTREMVASAIGMVWNQNAEMSPLIDFLFAQAKDRRVTLGGLDDQLGSRGAFYSLADFPAELAGHVSPQRREECRERFRRRIWSAYSKETPYDEVEREQIRDCLAQARSALHRSPRDEAIELAQMIGNFERFLARDFTPPTARLPDRARSMFLNLEWLAGQMKRDARIIIWSSNSHVAKDASALEPYSAGPNLGSLVKHAYGSRAFALGFSAASGSFRYTVRTSKPIPPAPSGSVEALALMGHGRSVAYLSPGRLEKLETRPGALFDDHQYITARWAKVHDGVVVFRSERPPVRLDE